MRYIDGQWLPNVDEVINTYFPANLPASYAVKSYIKQNSAVLIHSLKEHCLRAALLNAFDRVADTRWAETCFDWVIFISKLLHKVSTG